MNEIKFWRALFYVVAIAAAIVFLTLVWQVVIPFLLGLVIAYLVQPLVDRFVALGLRRDRVVIVLYAVLVVVTSTLAAFLLPRLYTEANAALQVIPSYAEAVNRTIERANVEIQSVLYRVIGSKAEAFSITFRADQFLEGLVFEPQNLMSVVHLGLWIFIIPFVSFFALSHGRQWIDFLFDATPSEYVESLLGLMAEVNSALGGYVRGQLLDALCVGFFTMIGLYLLGVDGAVLLGVVTGFLNLVPFMAPIVGGALALITASFQDLGTSTLVGIIIIYVLGRILDDFVFIPFVVGYSVKLHPVLMLFAVLAGFHIAGFLGLVFAIPLTAVIKVVLSIIVRSRRETLLFQYQGVIS